MRLISCHVISFGKLQNIKYDFEDNLTVITEGNSFGKTTLASFITSMFYGLPTLRRQDLSNERRRYDPWQGGTYGGVLTFKYKGRKYQIERDFNKNTFRLLDISAVTQQEVRQLDGKPIDGNNFGDTLFGINIDSFKRSAYIPQEYIICSEIESGLNDKLRNLINATKQDHSLSDALGELDKAFFSIQTKRGKGKLYYVTEHIQQLKNKINESEICFNNAQRERDKLHVLEQQLNNLNSKIEQAEELIKHENRVETLLAQQKYFAAINESIDSCKKKLLELNQFFKGGNVNDVDIDAIKDKIETFSKQQSLVAKLEAEISLEKTRLDSMKEASSVNLQAKQALSNQVNKDKENKEQTLRDKTIAENQILTLKNAQKHRGLLFVLLCVFTLGIYWFLSKKKSKLRKQKIKNLENLINEYNKTLYQLDLSIDDLQTQIGKIDNQGLDSDTKKLSNLEESLQKQKGWLGGYENEVKNLLKAFDCQSKGYSDCYYEIKEKHTEYRQVIQDHETNNAKLQAFLENKDKEKLKQQIQHKYSLSELQEEKKEFEKQRIKHINEISGLKSSIAKSEEMAEDLSDYENELSNYQETKDRLQSELDVLNQTKEFLKTASKNLENRYLAPLLERSKDIIRHYDPDKCDIELDGDAKILIKTDGIGRELDYFSKGIKELISICMRFALVDLIFKDTKKPFIILDDPFANLDNPKLEAAKNFIKNLSKDYQIIYLTCHDSRKIA